ncbi:MAG: putative beta-lysine N-acetyltransferase [Myxococcota bacterium]
MKNGGKEPVPGAEATTEPEASGARGDANAEQVGEWAAVEPGDKGLGLAHLVLDKGVRTKAIGQLYGLEFDIEDAGFEVSVFFDRYSRRLKVVDYEATDYRAMCERLTYLAKANEFTKIFLKAHQHDWQHFLALGFVLEGIIKYFYRGHDAFVLSKFLTAERADTRDLVDESRLIEKLMKRPRTYNPPPLPEGYRLVIAGREHVPQMVRLYRRVFPTYPSPLTHPDYIDQTMQSHVLYRVVLNPKGRVVSAASADLDEKNSNAELTDCATLKSERGKALMYHLLSRLEDDLRERGITTGYTLARAPSVGMNRVFYRLGYEYSGRLVNNCDIAGSFEDMNIWVKQLLPAGSEGSEAGGDSGAGDAPAAG